MHVDRSTLTQTERTRTTVRIAILGGTGKEGAGLAQRWAQAGHEIVIGSRDPERARAKAAELAQRVPGARAEGMSNRAAAESAQIVIVAVPASGVEATLPEVREACRGKVVVSAVVPLTFGGGRLFTPPPQGSSAELAQELLGPEARVVAAFHHIAAHELSSTEHSIECDLLLCGADPDARKAVAELGASIGLRAVDVGALSNAGPLEGITAVLATVNRRYKLKNSGIKITGLP
jgi:8-hydroxy-5-deazaflavin:NADPH oxidoreductase